MAGVPELRMRWIAVPNPVANTTLTATPITTSTATKCR